MQDPVGFWDPAGEGLCMRHFFLVVGRFVPHGEPALKQTHSDTLAAGFTADGSVENFKRRRQTELKHGRMARCKS